jgi:hypothetical protein
MDCDSSRCIHNHGDKALYQGGIDNHCVQFELETLEDPSWGVSLFQT